MQHAVKEFKTNSDFLTLGLFYSIDSGKESTLQSFVKTDYG